MQKILIAIAFALAITTVYGGYTATGTWPKPLQSLGVDGNSSYTNTSSGALGLYVTNTGEISLLNTILTTGNANASLNVWTAYWKKIDSKAITGGANASVSWTVIRPTSTLLGYFLTFTVDNSTGIPLMKVYQQPLAGGATISFTFGSNTNATYSPMMIGGGNNGKTLYVVYEAASQKLNITSFTLGGSANPTEYTIPTTNYDSLSFRATWGEALKSTQVWALWTEQGNYKDALVDLSSGATTSNAVGFNTTYRCQAYSTDKKWYGTLCSQINNGTLQTQVRNGSAAFVPLFSYNASLNTLSSVEPYGPYIAVFFTNVNNGSVFYSYELWNLDTFTIYNTTTIPSRVNYLNVDSSSTFTQVRLPAGGIYALIYNNANSSNPNSTISGISAGILLGSSYLTTVFGFIMTVIAGLFLF